MTDLSTQVGFGACNLPPGYVVLRVDDHTMWVRLVDGGADWDREGAVHWDRWASLRGAWADFRSKGAVS